jgi:hypothetical protein
VGTRHEAHLKDNASCQSYGKILSSIAAAGGVVKELLSFEIHKPAGFLTAMLLYLWLT